jgi:hypothetical protein
VPEFEQLKRKNTGMKDIVSKQDNLFIIKLLVLTVFISLPVLLCGLRYYACAFRCNSLENYIVPIVFCQPVDHGRFILIIESPLINQNFLFATKSPRHQAAQSIVYQFIKLGESFVSSWQKKPFRVRLKNLIYNLPP